MHWLICFSQLSYNSQLWVIDWVPFSLQMVATLHEACQGYPEWKRQHNPHWKPWHNPEQMTKPRVKLEDVRSQREPKLLALSPWAMLILNSFLFYSAIQHLLIYNLQQRNLLERSLAAAVKNESKVFRWIRYLLSLTILALPNSLCFGVT